MLTEREARRLDLEMWRPLLNDIPDDTQLIVTGQMGLDSLRTALSVVHSVVLRRG